MIKNYVRFDSTSVPTSVLATQVANCASLQLVTGHDYLMKVDPATFTHAYLLLGSNPNRFGSDLSPHLTTVNDFFSKTPAEECITLNFGTSDFKRRYSEDLGVALAALLMVELFGISWQSLCQIPENRKLSKKRPDFEGFDALENRYIFEAKGTCRLDSIDKTIDRAIGQVKKYPEAALRKIAIVSYLCGNPRAFPSYSFFVDPELPDIVPPDADHARLLHREKILEFAGCNAAAASYVKYLSAKFSFERKFALESPNTLAELRLPFYQDSRTSLLRTEFLDHLRRETDLLEVIEHGGHLVRATRRIVALPSGTKYEVLTGFSTALLEAFQKDDVSITASMKDDCYSSPELSFSQFSDGSFFSIVIAEE